MTDFILIKIILFKINIHCINKDSKILYKFLKVIYKIVIMKVMFKINNFFKAIRNQ